MSIDSTSSSYFHQKTEDFDGGKMTSIMRKRTKNEPIQCIAFWINVCLNDVALFKYVGQPYFGWKKNWFRPFSILSQFESSINEKDDYIDTVSSFF